MERTEWAFLRGRQEGLAFSYSCLQAERSMVICIDKGLTMTAAAAIPTEATSLLKFNDDQDQ